MVPAPKQLKPRLELLREEYVLVQAWKKTAAYIRYHTWFSDTLALDRAAVNLPAFIGELRERLQSPEGWQNSPLRIVPAPKSQRWRVREGVWEPVKKGATSARLRPFAHVSLADQVVATALMLCLADRVETLQRNPRQSIRDVGARKQVTSYGNRLFCDAIGEKEPKELRHRWGSAKLYRAYYQDYKTFLSRPQVAGESIQLAQEKRVYVVHADLRQFYDRVRPELLGAAIDRIRRDDDEPAFFSLAKSVLDWGWHSRDEKDVRIYAEQADLEDFTRVALPQGLVASGFFANVVLLPFDEALRAAIGTEISPGIVMADACRYVDDLRILIAVDHGEESSLSDLEEIVSDWLKEILDEKAPGLKLSPEKTQVAALGGDERPLVRQSAKMDRIQSAVSGGFDALGGKEILDAIQGLMRSQEALSEEDENRWRFSPVPDVRDETVARFGAARYRTTFRSIRPLLDDDTQDELPPESGETRPDKRMSLARTRGELDKDAQAFALSLIKRWIDDPSNIRLLRIGLDLWPEAKLLCEVLSLLRPFTEKGGRRKAPRRVAWYCLAEVLRAGATETGLVADTESLPSAIDLKSYREELREEAARLVALPGPTIPWYLRQQALLFLAACDPAKAPVTRTGRGPETRHYRELIRFLRGEGDRLRSSDFATLAVLARRAFVDRARAIELTRSGLSPSRKQQLAQRDPSFLLEFLDHETDALPVDDLPPRLREDLCLASEASDEDHGTLVKAALPHTHPNDSLGDELSLVKVVLHADPDNSLRNELSLLHFANAFLKQWKEERPPRVIAPGQVRLKLTENKAVAEVETLRILGSRADTSGSMYEVPAWCNDGERWRFQLGFLLRFILSRHPDFTRPVRRASWKEDESAYRPVESHWYQRLYGLFSGQPAFGDDWVPITDWMEGFLLALLRWPGCRATDEFIWVEQGIDEARMQIRKRITDLEQRRGDATRALILPLVAKRPSDECGQRPLRACIVQTVTPTDKDFHITDLKLNDSTIRRRHRNHLSAVLEAVKRMLYLRETHKVSERHQGRLDWLILPELAVHPKDVRTHLVPFARAHKAIILTGLTYEEILTGQPLVNSALWVIPEWSDDYGLQIRILRQGKKHLAPDEEDFSKDGERVLQGFRPCQWLIGYPWSNATGSRPAWLTAAVCYDATDIGLAADLRNKSDILAIPAFNKDVKTFDQMALALHYHMFQLVIVANSGQYGGSNAYWPRTDSHIRQVFHTHGQPQASISFLEIDDIGAFLGRRNVSGAKAVDWKHPPAGLKDGHEPKKALPKSGDPPA